MQLTGKKSRLERMCEIIRHFVFKGLGANKIKINFSAVIFVLCLISVSYGQIKNPNGKDLSSVFVQIEQLIKQNKFDEAAQISQENLNKDPASYKLNFLLGKTFFKQGKYQNAIDKLTIAKGKFEVNSIENKEVIQMLGLGHYVLGHLAESIEYFEQIVKKSPENQEINYALGICYIQTRQPVKSRAVYASLFGFPTNSPAAYLLNAQMHIRQRFEETAEIELIEALKLDAKLPQANFILGELAIYKADVEKGIAFLNKEIALNPANAMAYYRLGEGLTRQLKWDESIPYLQKSIWLNPFFSGPYIVLGKVYLKKQDLGNAENLLRRSTAIDPNNFGAHYLLGQVLQQGGKTEEAKIEFALAEKLRGNGEKEP